jgi:hypothetical protein
MAINSNIKAILVTGAHRSGTSWVGKMLAASPKLAYISEPLNLLHRPGVMRATVEHWYTYICEENESQFLTPMQETIDLRYHLFREIRSLRSLRDFFRMVRDRSNFLIGRIRHQIPLLKDPFAIFSAAWFAQRLGCYVVIMVRHPAAFTSSLLRLKWSFDFSDLLKQPLLMRDWLEPYRAEMVQILAKSDDDVLAQSCLLWKIIYDVVSQLEDRYPQFLVVRHEDLSRDPLEGFRDIYSMMGLEFTRKEAQTILKFSGRDNPKENPDREKYSIRLDSRVSLNNWKKRLSRAEIDRIQVLTEDIAHRYYSSEEWD